MPVARVEPGLLAPTGKGPGWAVPVCAVVEDMAGEPGVLRVEGRDGDWNELSSLDHAALAQVEAFLRESPLLTIAVGGNARVGVRGFDLYTDDANEADRWLRGFEASPFARLAAALLARRSDGTTWGGLVAESATYSMLQSGSEFRHWLADHGAGRDGSRRESARSDEDRGSPRVRATHSAEVTEIVLTRAARHNALDGQMREELYAALEEASRARTVVVRGEGPSFCSGGDLDEFGTFPDPVQAHVVRMSRSLALRFAGLGPRMIAGIHGACLGAGIELPAFAGYVVAAEDACIGLPEGDLGLIPGAGGTVSVRRRAGGERMLQLILTGEPVNAATALEWGLVDEVVATSELVGRLSELAERAA